LFLGSSAGGWGLHAGEASPASGKALLGLLDAPLLFVKRYNYLGIHIYDTFYKWRPGGGIYMLENPSAPPDRQRVRPIIDPYTPGGPGGGIYSDPEISWDGERLLFCHKPAQGGSTSIYEMRIDGSGLRRLTDPTSCCTSYRGSHGGQHDLTPAYLPDGRILFTSTRPSGLVPCANEGVNILHVMNADGSDIHPISVNNVNEFDPCVLPDGRILFGRWEYVDKTALTQQSLWTIFPDGTNETALFANNLVRPEALLDARPVPGAAHLVVSSFTRHNAPPRGSIAIVDTYLSKNSPKAITPLEHPENPTFDLGDSCEPWPLSRDVVLYSGKLPGGKYNAILMIDTGGHRLAVHADPEIDCHSPMLVKPRRPPRVIAPSTLRSRRTGRFAVQDIYRGLGGVKRGEVKWLRVIEETSRVSPTPGGAYNQTFLISAALAFSVKNVLGIVPVEPDGSAHFEVPSGRAVYFQALDGEGRLIQSMRTFVQAAPGVTRSCIGCHEHKESAPSNGGMPRAPQREAHRLAPESWGSGFIDYPGMVQPILDRHCVPCHGGEKGFAGRLDLTGGWTEHFNISYENLVSRRETQLTAYLISGIDCMNGTANWSARVFPPRSHGSATAPLAKELIGGHGGRIPDLSRKERDLLLAWIDTNGVYYGTWNYSKHGCSVKEWGSIKNALIGEMQAAGCMRCHGENGRPLVFENDWFNLRQPELSRIIRAPLAEGRDGLGLGLCRGGRIDPRRQRIQLMRTGGYVHHVLPLDAFKPERVSLPEPAGKPVVTFTSTADPHYRAMLEIIRQGRRKALAAPRVDMPGVEVQPGSCRQFLPPPLPDPLPLLETRVSRDGAVSLSWERSARTIGLSAEVHRGAAPGFPTGPETLIENTNLWEYTDRDAPQGTQHYAVVLLSGRDRAKPMRATVTVPPPRPPAPPAGLVATPAPGRVDLRWQGDDDIRIRYHVYRAPAGTGEYRRLTPEPTPLFRFSDAGAGEGARHRYTARAINRRGIESDPAPSVEAAPLPEIKAPLFAAAFAGNAGAALHGGGTAAGRLQGQARIGEAALDLRQGGFATFQHRPEFDLNGRITIECRVKMERESQMPVILSCGHWNQAGWFLQRIGSGWRWHVGGIDCDGGKPAPGRWTHLVGTFDGRKARLFQDGRLVAEREGDAIRTPWKGDLHVGQYSGGPGPQYQVHGWIARVRIYGRSLSAEDVKTAQEDPSRDLLNL